MPSQYARVVTVDYAPDKDHAVVLLEYNEPPTVEQYVVLCENTPSGWVERQSGSGGEFSWMATRTDLARGVEIAWGPPPTVRWDVPASDVPELPDPDRW